ncbi:TrbM/KikA/MpfK family conjugal transfer protein [Pseudomonas syringae]|uniref:TrbM/KikA/MpfK family conjugal transfer protein n=1 Tax=Pseudomonas syringae TaxID=317 RepID=UPI00200A4F97|nr:TrbM/KikA/MpfK family conjugal transfer protein [Pseudomonas syringae]MCK9709889.1 killer protein [Pseudomonas syringae pv. syringae]
MKKILIAVTVTALLSMQSMIAQAGPCETVLCMAGMLQGKGTVENCDGPVGDFFSIVVKKNGSFKPDATQAARREFVNQCPSAGDWGDKVADAYGTVRK